MSKADSKSTTKLAYGVDQAPEIFASEFLHVERIGPMVRLYFATTHSFFEVNGAVAERKVALKLLVSDEVCAALVHALSGGDFPHCEPAAESGTAGLPAGHGTTH